MRQAYSPIDPTAKTRAEVIAELRRRIDELEAKDPSQIGELAALVERKLAPMAAPAMGAYLPTFSPTPPLDSFKCAVCGRGFGVLPCAICSAPHCDRCDLVHWESCRPSRGRR
jgi:hypothetical protein